MRKEFYDFLTSIGRTPRKILHVGANSGQEISLYHSLGLEAWHVEAIPVLCQQVSEKCKTYPSQHAINACLSNADGLDVEFNIASNGGQSSSLLKLGRHAVEYPEITYQDKLILKTKTIDGLIREGTLPRDIDFLVLDAQGAEKLILDGASLLLASGHLVSCQIEAGVVPLYENSSSYLDIAKMLADYSLHLKCIQFNAKGWADALFTAPYWFEALLKSHIQTIGILRPSPTPAPLIRIGGNGDGAYLVPDDLTGIKACFSPGVSNRKDFEDELLERYSITSHMCDYSSDSDKFKTPLKPGQTFKKKWLDVDGSDNSISLEEWVLELEPEPSHDLILQIDIEGAEYRNLLGTPDSILRRFRIIVIELHSLIICNDYARFRKELGPLLERIDKYFLCVHAHPNNCCGEFKVAGTKLNLPNVHELTFLRRDRWNSVSETECYSPMLPHPLDISSNMPDRPPIFLNEEWLAPGERSLESTVKMLTDQVCFLERTSENPKIQQDTITDLYRLAQHAASRLPKPTDPESLESLTDLALGKPFTLSSKYGGGITEGRVEEQQPFFFHTGEGRNQSITIDLESESVLHQLCITNRTDTCLDRASCLFYCLHNHPDPDLLQALPVSQNKRFTTHGDPFCVTDLGGKRARYLTIFSPTKTILHFSRVSILGIPCI